MSANPPTRMPPQPGPAAVGAVAGDQGKGGALRGLHAIPEVTAACSCPTTKPYKIGDEIYLILALMDDPNKYPIAGKVAWITPAGANNNKAQGIGVHFPDDETGQRAKPAHRRNPRRRAAFVARHPHAVTHPIL